MWTKAKLILLAIAIIVTAVVIVITAVRGDSLSLPVAKTQVID